MEDECNLGAMIQQEDDGTFSAVVVMARMKTAEDAQAMADVMLNVIADYIESQGIKPVSKSHEVH